MTIAHLCRIVAITTVTDPDGEGHAADVIEHTADLSDGTAAREHQQFWSGRDWGAGYPALFAWCDSQGAAERFQ
jgi:hypothetical protein